MKSPITNTLLMVEPVAFGFNPETAVNNYFQQQDKMSAAEIQRLALAEFSAMVKQLQDKGIHVIVVKIRPNLIRPIPFSEQLDFFHETEGLLFTRCLPKTAGKSAEGKLFSLSLIRVIGFQKKPIIRFLKKTTAFWKEQAAWRSTGKIKLHTQLCRKEPIKRCFCSFATILGIGPSVFQPIKQLKDSVCRFIIPMSCFA